MHIDISKYGNVSIQSFDMIELCGRDSVRAAARAVDPKAAAVSMLVANTRHRSEMIADAITHVNGQPVMQPYNAWEDWNLRTQEMVVNAFDFLNSLSQAEEKDFLAHLKTIRETGSSVDGTTSPTPGTSAKP